jgi:hypothetical protein
MWPYSLFVPQKCDEFLGFVGFLAGPVYDRIVIGAEEDGNTGLFAINFHFAVKVFYGDGNFIVARSADRIDFLGPASSQFLFLH